MSEGNEMKGRCFKRIQHLFILVTVVLLSLQWSISVTPLSFFSGKTWYPVTFLFSSSPIAWAGPNQNTGLKEMMEGHHGIMALDTLRRWFKDEFEYVTTYRYFDRGYARLKKGDLKGAERDFQAIVKKDPDNMIAPLYVAHIKSQTGRQDEATEILEDYLKRFDENGYAHLSLAFLYLDGDKVREAVKHLERASFLYKDDKEMEAIANANLAELYLQEGEYDKALNIFLVLKKRLPQDGLLSYKIGLCLNALHRYNEAQSYLETAFAASGLTAMQRNACRLELSFVMLKMGLRSEAIDLLREVIANSDESDKIHNLAGSQLVEVYFYEYRAIREPDTAEQYLRGLAGREDTPPGVRTRARMELAFLLIRAKRFMQAEVILEEILERPDLDRGYRSLALRNLVEVKFRLRNFKEVIETAESAYKSSRDLSLLLLMAECNVKLKRFEAAEKLFLRISSDRTSSPELKHKALLGLGNIYLAKGEIKKARAPFEAVLEIAPDDSYAMKSLMEIAKKRKRAGRFLSYARRVERRDRSKNFQTEVASTVAELGKHRKALSLFKKALEKEENHEAQAKIYKEMGFLSLKLGDRESSIRYFNGNLSLSKKRSPEVLEQLALIHINAGNCDRSIPLLKELIHIRQDFDHYIKLARCLDATDDNKGASHNYQAALKIRFDTDAAMELILLKEKSGEIKDAVRMLNNMLMEEDLDDRTKFTVFLLLSKYNGILGHRKLQKEYAQKALDIAPDDVSPTEMAYPLVVTGTPSPILEEYEEDIRMQKAPKARAEAAVKLANLYESANNLEKALEFLNVAFEETPTIPLRFKRGLLLYRKGLLEQAQEDFHAALEMKPQSVLYLAYILQKEGEPGLAIDLLEDMLNRNKVTNLKDRVGLLEQLSYLYFGEGQTEKSLGTAEEAILEQGDGKASSLMVKARCLNLLGRAEEAMTIARTGASEARTSEENAIFHEIMGDAARIMGQYDESILHYRIYLTYHKEDASAYYSIAGNYFKMHDYEKSRVCFEEALRLDPGNLKYLPAYGFVLMRLNENASALEVLERYLKNYPYDLNVLETVGYLNMGECRNKKAMEQFRQAIDMNRLHISYAPDEPDPDGKKNHLYGLKEELLNLEKDFSLSAYIHRMDLAGSDESRVFRGTIPSEIGLEAGWRPPVIGFRNRRIFELTGRLLGSFENESWSYDEDSTQLALGFKYKPFTSVNFFASFERLIKLGDNSENNWLLRGMASEDWGRNPHFGHKIRHSGSFYMDYGAFLENTESRFRKNSRRQVFYGEIKDGILFSIHKDWGLIPHAIVDIHWDDTGHPLGEYLEGGIGMELLGWLHETEYKAHDWRLSISIQYKWGSFKDTPPGEGGKDYRGLVVGIEITH